MQVFDSFWANFCVWYKVSVQLYSFACGYPVFPKLFIEETILSIDWCWCSVRDHLIMCVRVYFLALCSMLLVYMSVFRPAPCLWLLFCNDFLKSGSVTSPFLLFFFRIILVIRGQLRFNRNFRTNFYISSKKGHWVFFLFFFFLKKLHWLCRSLWVVLTF